MNNYTVKCILPTESEGEKEGKEGRKEMSLPKLCIFLRVPVEPMPSHHVRFQIFFSGQEVGEGVKKAQNLSLLFRLILELTTYR